MAGKRIDSPLMREIREQGFRCEFVARQLGLSKWTLSRIEAGVQKPPTGFYERAAAFLRVPLHRVVPVAVERDKAA